MHGETLKGVQTISDSFLSKFQPP